MNASITSWQRRGAAAALRSLGRTTLPVVAIVGTVADAYGGRPDASPVEFLADLVDWPTCEYVPIGDGRFGCSECGNTVRLDFDVPVTDETSMPFKHCPNCGAEVRR